MVRKRKKPIPEPVLVPLRLPWGPVLRVSGTMLLLLAALAGVVAIGLAASQAIGNHDRYRLPLQAIEFPPPPFTDHATMLSEIRYQSERPGTFNPFSPTECTELHAAFARHPWVATVQPGKLAPGGRYILPLVYREPLLRITITDGTPAERMVDDTGVLLPPVVPPDQLAVLINRVSLNDTAAGQRWDDPLIQRATELARRYPAAHIEKTEKTWRITETTGRVLLVSW